MTSRNSLDVAELLEYTNQVLRTSVCVPAIRTGWISALETVLFRTGNYRGFRYLGVKEVPRHMKPGIRMGEGGEMLSYEERFAQTDDTRRCYY